MRFSIIIPVYNIKGSYLRQCFDSVLAQDFLDYEVVVIDDGSTNGSECVCDEYASKDRSIKLIHQTNAGVSVARNRGIEEAKGDYILFVDADDWVEPTMLSLVEQVLAQEDYDIVRWGGVREYVGRTEKVGFISDEKLVLEGGSSIKKALLNKILYPYNNEGQDVWAGCVFCSAYRSKLVKESGVRFDKNQRIAEDLLFNLQLYGFCEHACLAPLSLYHYRQCISVLHGRFIPYYDDEMIKWFAKLTSEIAGEIDIETDSYLQYHYRQQCYRTFSYQVFHKGNPAPLNKKLKEARHITNKEPYINAFENFSLQCVEKHKKTIIKFCLVKYQLLMLYFVILNAAKKHKTEAFILEELDAGQTRGMNCLHEGKNDISCEAN